MALMTVKCSQPMDGLTVSEDCCLAFGDHILEEPTEQCCEHHPKGGVLREGLGTSAHNPGACAGQGAEAGVSPAQTVPLPAAPGSNDGDSTIKKPQQPEGGAAEATSKGPVAPPEGWCCQLAAQSMGLRHEATCRVWSENNLHLLYLQRKAGVR